MQRRNLKPKGNRYYSWNVLTCILLLIGGNLAAFRLRIDPSIVEEGEAARYTVEFLNPTQVPIRGNKEIVITVSINFNLTTAELGLGELTGISFPSSGTTLTCDDLTTGADYLAESSVNFIFTRASSYPTPSYATITTNDDAVVEQRERVVLGLEVAVNSNIPTHITGSGGVVYIRDNDRKCHCFVYN